jgi:tight adherence protein B
MAAVALLVGGVTAFFLMKMDIDSGRRGKTAYAKWLNARYVRKFNEQLTDALGTMSNALRAGFSISQAFESVAESDMHPISDEFALLLQQMRVGMSFDDALSSLDKRIGSDDLTLVVTAIDIARKTGGNLTEIFDSISETIRARMRIERKVRTLTAQGRLQGIIVSLMPFFLCGVMTVMKPGMMIPFLTSVNGLACLAGASIMVLFGWIIIRKIVTIKV